MLSDTKMGISMSNYNYNSQDAQLNPCVSDLNCIGIDGLVSVIMPAYNCEKYIAASIKSVINQSYSTWELIIVDDCSKDNTTLVIEEYAEKYSNIKLIKHKVNSGSAAARNTAISEANGRYIAFLDSDDLWYPDKLDKQIHFMIDNGYFFTFTGYETFSSENNNAISVFSVPKSINYDQYLKNTIIGNLTVILDRWNIPNVHVEYGELEDVLTWMHFLKKGYTAFGLNQTLARYRVYATSKSGNKVKNAIRYFKCLWIEQGLSFPKSFICEIGYLYNASMKRLKGKGGKCE